LTKEAPHAVLNIFLSLID